MKGIILAGGKGTRLHPITVGFNKQLLPVYNKPMVYYPLSMLMLAGIQDILVISTPQAIPLFERLLENGSQWGLSFSYLVQDEPRGIAEAFVIGQDFIGDDTVCLVLGDNIFYGTTMPSRLQKAAQLEEGAIVFGYQVQTPQAYAVVDFESINNNMGKVISIEEKPSQPASRYAVPGLYFYDNQVVQIAKELSPSGRGELEITDLNRIYLEKDLLHVEILGRGIAWLDAGTHESLLQAANFIQAVEQRQGMMISCPEEIAYRMGYISYEQLSHLAHKMVDNDYADYLRKLEI